VGLNGAMFDQALGMMKLRYHNEYDHDRGTLLSHASNISAYHIDVTCCGVEPLLHLGCFGRIILFEYTTHGRSCLSQSCLSHTCLKGRQVLAVGYWSAPYEASPIETSVGDWR
jgi:hypothetical protein